MKAATRMLKGGLVSLALLAAAVDGAAPASASTVTTQSAGCNLYVCMVSNGFAAGLWTAQARLFGPTSCIQGHYHIWGPGFDRNFPDKCWGPDEWSPKAGGGPAGTVCAEFWGGPSPSGQWMSLGRPCVPTHG